MAEARGQRHAEGLARRTYTPQPVHSVKDRIWAWTGICAVCLTAGAAAGVWSIRHHADPLKSCVETPSQERLEAELTQTRLALAQEEAARTAIQKAADASAAEISRLTTEVNFLRGQRKAASR